jgi:predicted phage terminase large subunit-like protein
LKLSPQEAADTLLARRKARASLAEFSKHIAPEEPPALHHRLLCDSLDKVFNGEIKRLMVLMPPGSAKSTYATVRFPAYVMGRWDSEGVKKSIISGSYGQDLASSFGRKVRNLVRTPEYKSIFPATELSQDSQSKSEWETAQGCNYKSVGCGAGITGRRSDLGVIDDPIRGRKDADSPTVRDSVWNWYKSDFLTRLKPKSPEILIQTRWHEDDLAGRILPEKWSGESGLITARDGRDWHVICLPAQAGKNDLLGRAEGEYLWTDWFPVEWWEQTKKTMTLTGMRDWNSLYQQIPSATEGDFFKRHWFKRYSLDDLPSVRKYITTDYAVSEGKGDFTEFGVWGLDANQDIYACDWWYGQTSPDTWIEEQLNLIDEHKPLTTFGEKGVIQKATEPMLMKRSRERRVYGHFEWLARTADKAAMAQGFRARAAMGKVYIPDTEWGNRLLNQLCAFPAGRHDDAVDNCGLIGMALDEIVSATDKVEEVTKPVDKWDSAFGDDNNDDSWKAA